MAPAGGSRGGGAGRRRGGGRGATQEFLDRPDLRQAGRLDEAGGGGDAGEAGRRDRREEGLAFTFHRQQGLGWVPGPNVGVEVHPDAQPAGAEADGVQDDDGTQPQALPDGLELPSMDDLQSTTVTTLKWCPKAARGEFAR